MKGSKRSTFLQRLRSQKGNIVVYLIGGMILWFVFFAIKDWIKDTKDARVERDKKAAQQDTRYFPGDIYHNPYQQASSSH